MTVIPLRAKERDIAWPLSFSWPSPAATDLLWGDTDQSLLRDTVVENLFER